MESWDILGNLAKGLQVYLMQHHAEVLAELLVEATPKAGESTQPEDQRAWAIPAYHLRRLQRSLMRLQDHLRGVAGEPASKPRRAA